MLRGLPSGKKEKETRQLRLNSLERAGESPGSIVLSYTTEEPLAGDINAARTIYLRDVILVLKMFTKSTEGVDLDIGSDVKKGSLDSFK